MSDQAGYGDEDEVDGSYRSRSGLEYQAGGEDPDPLRYRRLVGFGSSGKMSSMLDCHCTNMSCPVFQGADLLIRPGYTHSALSISVI